MLGVAQLNRMRRDANKFLPDTATISRRTLTDDGRGGKLASYSELGEVACRLSAVNVRSRARDMVKGGSITASEAWIVSLPVDADVIETDRLTINSVVYEVVSSTERRSFDVNLRVIVKRV